MLKPHTGLDVVELDGENAAATVGNFHSCLAEGFYDGTIFHRVIDALMIQGGGFEPGMVRKPTRPPIRNEADLSSRGGLRNERNTIIMARSHDPLSATAQFFINPADNAILDHSAPVGRGWNDGVFGAVIEGREVVGKVQGVRTGVRGAHWSVPLEDVLIRKAEIT